MELMEIRDKNFCDRNRTPVHTLKVWKIEDKENSVRALIEERIGARKWQREAQFNKSVWSS